MKKYFLLGLLCWANWQHTSAQELYSMGLPPEPDEFYETIEVKAELTNDNYRNLASSASVKKYAPTPRSQGNYGTCAAWATGYCARTILEAQRYGWTDKSTITQNAFSYGFIYRVTSSDPSCWGAYTSRCVKNMHEIGIPKYSDYTIHCPQSSIPNSVYSTAAKYKIDGYARLWSNDKSSKERIDLAKTALANGKPIVISMICPNSFHNPRSAVWTPTESPNSNPSNPHGRHAMCVVGYDDNKYGGAFEIQNSWGPSWGNGGYIWVKYADFADFVYQAYELYSFEKEVEEEVVLSGSVRIQLDTKQDMEADLQSDDTYKVDRAYRSGTRFRIYISNNQPAYVYAFGTDLTSDTYQVFPHKPNVSPALTYSKNDVPIPSDTEHVRMDNKVGTDYLCVLYSNKPLDLDEIRRKVEAQSNVYTPREKLERVLGDKLMSEDEVSYDRNEMAFNAKSKKGSVAAVVLAIEHID